MDFLDKFLEKTRKKQKPTINAEELSHAETVFIDGGEGGGEIIEIVFMDQDP